MLLSRLSRSRLLERLLPVAAAATTAAAGGGSGAATAATATLAAPWLQHSSRCSSSHGTSDHEPHAAGHVHAQPDLHAHDHAWQHEEQVEPAASTHADDPEFLRQRQQLLAAALRHVPELGWAGGAAAAAAARNLGLSPAAAGMLGSDAGLVHIFVADCNQRLEAELAAQQDQLAQLDVRCARDTGM